MHFKLGMGTPIRFSHNSKYVSYIDIYQDKPYLVWHHGYQHPDTRTRTSRPVQPNFSIVEGTTYDFAITYDATAFNAGPGTHPNIPPDGRAARTRTAASSSTFAT